MMRSKARRAERLEARPVTWWAQHFQQAPIKTLSSLALAMGGLVLLGFFLRIRFMPDVDLAGSTALLLAAALVGLGIMCAAIFVLAVPGLTTRHMLSDVHLEVGGAALATMIVPSVVSIVFIIVDGIYFKDSPLLSNQTTTAATIGLLAGTALIGAHALPAELQTSNHPPASYIRKVWALASTGVMWLLGMLMAVDFSLQLAADSDHPDWLIVCLIGAWLLFVVGFNSMTARLPTRGAWLAGPAMGLVSLLVLVLMTGSFTTFSAATVRALGFGELKDVDLVLAAPACDALRSSAATNLRCAGAPGAPGILRNVFLRSRIGGQIVVEPQAARAGMSDRVILRKEDVLVWTVRAKSTKTK